MSDKLVSLKGVKTYENNPFVVDLKGKMFLQPRANAIIAKGENIVNTTTGEVLREATLLGRRKIVDKSQFAKIYASEIGILHDLSRSGIMVFMHLSKVMDYENKALFDYKKQYTKLGYKTEVPALKGIRELITKNIIAPHIISGIWWLNPAIVCKGERFAKYTEYLTEEEAKREQEYLIKKQGKRFIDSLPEDIETKFKLAGERNPINSDNDELPPMGNLPFDDDSPYN